ncbi:glycoside hydrolase family 43 protein [Pseudochryseolinea flava]|uniref:Glycosyl hydrolase family 43 n=1 Tax=Pseudochryseolinea flava TaxID=2059302 RepID=A0A364XXG0_9BACT|nr:glycoside hydrolase family 43 protein [Pseudochryseolinea flava]RAV98971.1 glycosyl hydrolase family 43 [Pseudochryseolinea flava]
MKRITRIDFFNIQRTTAGVISKVLFALILVISSCGSNASDPTPEPPTVKRFVNPLVTGADPWIIKKDGFYYYTHTLGNRIELWKTTAVSQLKSVAGHQVFKPEAGKDNSENLWAPEMFFLNNKWYIYYTAGKGPDQTQRTWVLENENANPLNASWVDKGRIFASDADFWSIDGTVLEYKEKLYFLWSGRPDISVQNQNIYIAEMENPWTLKTPTKMLTAPELSWEVHGGPVNEGPEILKNKDGQVFMVYSASGCWTDDYQLGMLTLKVDGDPMEVSDWTKSTKPVFTKSPQNLAYGPGHNAFFKSVDDKEDWIIYHANTNSGDGCSPKRNVRAQRFTWNNDGTPNFGTPVHVNSPQPVPSGE